MGDTVKQFALKGDWEKNPMMHRGIKPVWATRRSNVVPTALHPCQWCFFTLGPPKNYQPSYRLLFQQNKYHLSNTLGYKNGYAVPKRPEVGIGGKPIEYNQLSESDLDHLANFNPTLTYGQAKQAPPEDFIPGHVAWDKKVFIGPHPTMFVILVVLERMINLYI